eukprot:5377644-Pyramimonas_sp.AAC.1
MALFKLAHEHCSCKRAFPYQFGRMLFDMFVFAGTQEFLGTVSRPGGADPVAILLPRSSHL